MKVSTTVNKIIAKAYKNILFYISSMCGLFRTWFEYFMLMGEVLAFLFFNLSPCLG